MRVIIDAGLPQYLKIADEIVTRQTMFAQMQMSTANGTDTEHKQVMQFETEAQTKSKRKQKQAANRPKEQRAAREKAKRDEHEPARQAQIERNREENAERKRIEKTEREMAEKASLELSARLAIERKERKEQAERERLRKEILRRAEKEARKNPVPSQSVRAEQAAIKREARAERKRAAQVERERVEKIQREHAEQLAHERKQEREAQVERLRKAQEKRQAMQTRILVDADACPYSEIAVTLAKKANLQCIYAYDGFEVEGEMLFAKRIVFQNNPEGADEELSKFIKSGDIVLTENKDLEKLCLNVNAGIFSSSNVSFSKTSEHNIKMMTVVQNLSTEYEKWLELENERIAQAERERAEQIEQGAHARITEQAAQNEHERDTKADRPNIYIDADNWNNLTIAQRVAAQYGLRCALVIDGFEIEGENLRARGIVFQNNPDGDSEEIAQIVNVGDIVLTLSKVVKRQCIGAKVFVFTMKGKVYPEVAAFSEKLTIIKRVLIEEHAKLMKAERDRSLGMQTDSDRAVSDALAQDERAERNRVNYYSLMNKRQHEEQAQNEQMKIVLDIYNYREISLVEEIAEHFGVRCIATVSESFAGIETKYAERIVIPSCSGNMLEETAKFVNAHDVIITESQELRVLCHSKNAVVFTSGGDIATSNVIDQFVKINYKEFFDDPCNIYGKNLSALKYNRRKKTAGGRVYNRRVFAARLILYMTSVQNAQSLASVVACVRERQAERERVATELAERERAEQERLERLERERKERERKAALERLKQELEAQQEEEARVRAVRERAERERAYREQAKRNEAKWAQEAQTRRERKEQAIQERKAKQKEESASKGTARDTKRTPTQTSNRKKMRIIIDADGRAVPFVAEEIAEEYGLKCIAVFNSSHDFYFEYAEARRVPIGYNEADNAIANLVRAGDVVVTDDVALASRCLARGAFAMRVSVNVNLKM